MREKGNNKNQTKKGGKQVDKQVDKKGDKKDDKQVDKKGDKQVDKKGDKKENKEKKNVNTIDKLLEKITLDTVIEAMVEYKCLVAKSIIIKIIGEDTFEKLSDTDKQIIIKKVNELRIKNR